MAKALTYRRRVEAGACYLDAVLPGWADRIDLKSLDLASGCNCVLGQVLPDGYFSPSVVGLASGGASLMGFDTLVAVDQDQAARLGLHLREIDTETEFKALTREWRKLIRTRRGEA